MFGVRAAIRYVGGPVVGVTVCDGLLAAGPSRGTRQPDRANQSFAADYWRPRAQRGNALDQRFLGWCYAHGLWVKQDKAEAVTWY